MFSKISQSESCENCSHEFEISNWLKILYTEELPQMMPKFPQSARENATKTFIPKKGNEE